MRNLKFIFLLICGTVLAQDADLVLQSEMGALPKYDLKFWEVSKSVDSIGSRTYVLKDGNIVIKEKASFIFNDDAFLQKEIRTYYYSDRPRTSSTSYEYDENGLVSLTRGNGQVIKYEKSPDGKFRFIRKKKIHYRDNLLEYYSEDQIINKDNTRYEYHKGWYKQIFSATGYITGNKHTEIIRYYYDYKLYAEIHKAKKHIRINVFNQQFYKEGIDPNAWISYIDKKLTDSSGLDAIIPDPMESVEYLAQGFEKIRLDKFDNYTDWTRSYRLSRSYTEELNKEYTFRKIYFTDGTEVGSTDFDKNWLSSLPTSLY
ncbi:hypothetical protein BST97_05855 [Nonlabens spongiae]|uniref:DUF4595 domain-containing protein n=1 Tax=Nonlabens spongiae TaxID=331648 RepID=A0A1W6MJA0_9FLAO|nr:hypothetical protein [Nonlabens spongiae]ARN77549.1 hypothetical protein BST97_05855 [Nonlabens spongiae]